MKKNENENIIDITYDHFIQHNHPGILNIIKDV